MRTCTTNVAGVYSTSGRIFARGNGRCRVRVCASIARTRSRHGFRSPRQLPQLRETTWMPGWTQCSKRSPAPAVIALLKTSCRFCSGPARFTDGDAPDLCEPTWGDRQHASLRIQLPAMRSFLRGARLRWRIRRVSGMSWPASRPAMERSGQAARRSIRVADGWLRSEASPLRPRLLPLRVAGTPERAVRQI